MDSSDSAGSAGSAGDLFEPDQISPSVPAAKALEFLETFGFFYQENEVVGQLVEKLLAAPPPDDVKIGRLENLLSKDPCYQEIRKRYSGKLRLRLRWGETPGTYYRWAKRPTDEYATSSVIVYVMGPESHWICSSKSQTLDSDLGRDVRCEPEWQRIGVFKVEEELLKRYKRREINLKSGGFLIVQTLFSHQAVANRSFVFGLFDPKTSQSQIPASVPDGLA